MRSDTEAAIKSGLDRAGSLRPGSGRFDLSGGLRRFGDDWGAYGRASVESRLSKSWSAYSAAELGVVRSGRTKLNAEAMFGLRARW